MSLIDAKTVRPLGPGILVLDIPHKKALLALSLSLQKAQSVNFLSLIS